MMGSVTAVVTMVVVMEHIQASFPSRLGYQVPRYHISRASLVWSVCTLERVGLSSEMGHVQGDRSAIGTDKPDPKVKHDGRGSHSV